MARPCCRRRVGFTPEITRFKPAGVPARELRDVVTSLDELEAMRLADVEGLYHVEAAEHMGVSRATFGRVLESARRKVATALVAGHALRFEGGPVSCHHGHGPHHHHGRRRRHCRCGNSHS